MKRSKMQWAVSGLWACALLSVPALALAISTDSQQDLQAVPEPEVLALIGASAVAWWIARRGPRK